MSEKVMKLMGLEDATYKDKETKETEEYVKAKLKEEGEEAITVGVFSKSDAATLEKGKWYTVDVEKKGKFWNLKKLIGETEAPTNGSAAPVPSQDLAGLPEDPLVSGLNHAMDATGPIAAALVVHVGAQTYQALADIPAQVFKVLMNEWREQYAQGIHPIVISGTQGKVELPTQSVTKPNSAASRADTNGSTPQFETPKEALEWLGAPPRKLSFRLLKPHLPQDGRNNPFDFKVDELLAAADVLLKKEDLPFSEPGSQ